MSSTFENFQRKSQQTNKWQNKLIFDQNKLQSSRINYQNKSQNAHFDDYNTKFEKDVWIFDDDQKSYDDYFAYHSDDDYYEDKSYEKILKSSLTTESENV